MAKLTVSQQKSKVAATIKINGNKEITPPKDKILRDDQLDSSPNWKDGGYGFESLVGYASVLNLADERDFVHKKYVDDLIGTIDLTQYLPKSAGSGQALTGPLYFGNNFAHGLANIRDSSNIPYITASRFLSDQYGQGFVDFRDQTNGFGIKTGTSWGYFKTDNFSATRTIHFQNKDYTGVADITDIYAAVAGSWIVQGGYNPTITSDYPTSSDVTKPVPGGDIKAGYQWRIIEDGDLLGELVTKGDVVTAMVDDPATEDDWVITQVNIQYVPLDAAGSVTATGDQDWGGHGIDNISRISFEDGDDFTSFDLNIGTPELTGFDNATKTRTSLRMFTEQGTFDFNVNDLTTESPVYKGGFAFDPNDGLILSSESNQAIIDFSESLTGTRYKLPTKSDNDVFAMQSDLVGVVEDRVFTIKKTLTSAEIKTLSTTTFINLGITAPGVGKFINVVGACFRRRNHTTIYENFVIQLRAEGGNFGIVSFNLNNFLGNATQVALLNGQVSSGSQIMENAILRFYASTTPASGDADYDFYITYKICTF